MREHEPIKRLSVDHETKETTQKSIDERVIRSEYEMKWQSDTYTVAMIPQKRAIGLKTPSPFLATPAFSPHWNT